MEKIERVKFQITVNKSVADTLTRLSVEKGIPKSAVIALALEEYDKKEGRGKS